MDSLHEVLRSLYDEMIPMAGDMASVAQGIAGLGALFYVSLKVWQSLSRAESIDVFPLLRPFAIGICIMFFSTIVLGTINAVLSPIVTGTHSMLDTQVIDLNQLQEQKDMLEQEALLRDPLRSHWVSDDELDQKIEALGWSPSDLVTISSLYLDRQGYKMRQDLKEWFRNLLETMFQAAALVVDTIRTFFLIVLSILGPLAFALSVWDGFQSTLTEWFTRYISIYLWLPIADLLSAMLAKIHVLMLQRDIEQLSDPNYIPDTQSSTYIIFFIIGIVGYFTVPTVAGWVVQAGGAGNFTRNVTQLGNKVSNIAGAGTGAVAGNIAGKLKLKKK